MTDSNIPADTAPLTEQVDFLIKHVNNMSRKERVDYACKMSRELTNSLMYILQIIKIYKESKDANIEELINVIYKAQAESLPMQEYESILKLIDITIKSLE